MTLTKPFFIPNQNVGEHNMVDFVIVGGKAKKAKGRFGGECGRNYDRSYEGRHLKLTSKQLVAAALEELRTYEPAKSRAPASKPATEFNKKRDRSGSAPDRVPTDRAA